MAKPPTIPVRFYATSSGAEPVRDWLREMDRDDRRVIGADISTVEFGWPIGMPTCRPLGDGLWEVRSSLAGGRIARVIFAIHGGRMVLLHGFSKTTQKTPKADLELARNRKKDLGTMSVKRVARKARAAPAKRRVAPERGRVGSSFDDFLRATGDYEAVKSKAIKRVLAWQISEAMREDGLTKAEMAKRMGTSRSQLDRLLDPANDDVTLSTLARAAKALGREIRLELA